MKFLPIAVLLLTIFSCTSGPVTVPQDMPPSKIIQQAQEATDINRYRIAIQYYEILRERYGNINEYYCIAEYEIAFIQYKQRRYPEARRGFENLLVLYEAEGGETLPRQFKILSEKVLIRMAEKGH